jgi:hypothetical protein
MVKLTAGLGVLTLLAAVPAAALQEQTYQPKVVFKVNERNTYTMKMNMKMDMVAEQGAGALPNMEMVMDAVTQMKTVGVKPDGSGVITVKTAGGKIVVLGMEQNIPDSPAQTFDVDPRGRMKMRQVAAAGGPGAVMRQFMDPNQLSFMGAILPDKPVKVGETWEVEIDVAAAQKKTKVISTLLGLETVGGQPTLKIKQEMIMPFDMAMGMDGMPVKAGQKAAMTMKGELKVSGIINILEANSRLIKSTGDVTGSIDMILPEEVAAQSPFGSKMTMKMDAKVNMDLTKNEILAAEAPKKP